MIIHRMTEQDLAQVTDLEQQIFSEPWSEQGFRDTLEMDHVIFLVARDGDACMGYCGIYLAADEGEITNVAVDPVYRRQGVAQAMLQQLLQQAEKQGARHIFLEVEVLTRAPGHFMKSWDLLLAEYGKIFIRNLWKMPVLWCWTSNFHYFVSGRFFILGSSASLNHLERQVGT